MYKLFSQRKKEEEGEISDVYQYDSFPQPFRNQFIHIVNTILISDDLQYNPSEYYYELCRAFCREKGLKGLYGFGYENTREALEKYCDECSNEDFLDLLDFTFAYFMVGWRDDYVISLEIFNNSIEELNYRFAQHSLGYEFINDKLIIKTNEHIHKEIIKPAIVLLNNTLFAGAQQEFFDAFDCYKKGKNKDAIANAGKAFESAMKTICADMEYNYNPTKDTARDLIKILEDNAFYPTYLNSFMASIRTTLESGAPTVRNKTSGHGQGTSIITLPNEYVEYTLNLVATNIVFLVKIYNDKKAGN